VLAFSDLLEAGLRLFILLLGFLGVLSSSESLAADCAAIYSSDQLLTDLIEIEDLLKSDDKAGTLAEAKVIESGLDCMNESLPPILIGRVYRAVAGGLFYGGEEEAGKRWFRTAVEVDPSYIYGIEDVGASHPVRAVYDQIRSQDIGERVALEGKTLREGPKHMLDGRTLRSASARLDRPHLYQIVEGEMKSFVIEGNALPDVALSSGPVASASPKSDGKVAKAKKEKKPKKTKAPKEKVAKEKPTKEPKEKVAKEAPAKEPKEKVAKEAPAKEPKEKPAKEPKEKVAKEAPAKEPKEKVAKEAPAKEPKEKPAKEPKEKVAKEAPTKEPKEKVAKAPKEKPVKEPKEKVAKAPKVKPTKVKSSQPMGLTTTVIGRDRPPEQIPLIITGTVAIVGSGVLYAMAVLNKNEFDNLGTTGQTREKVLNKRQTANRLFLGSLAVFAVGTSTLTYGVIIDGKRGGVMPTLNIRF
jgi:hypothetical protein